MNAKLTETQTAILKAAASRPDGNIEPLPPNVRGGARAKVIEGLLARELILEANGHHLLTDAGYAAVGKRRPVPKGIQKMDSLAKRDTTNTLQKLDATVSEPAVVLAMRNLLAVWNEMFPEERCRLVRLLIARVQLKGEGIDIEWHPAGWSALMAELAPNSIGAELRELEMEPMA